MLVLGINAYELTSSAAFVKDGKVLFAICEERLSRIKRHKCFPILSIKEGLKFLNIKFTDIDAVSIGWNPSVEAFKLNGVLHSRPRELFYYKIQEVLFSLSKVDKNDSDWTLVRTSGNSVPDIYFVRHHLSHAANTAFQSPFKSGHILTLDYMGERETGCFGQFEDNSIKINEYSKQPSSTGAFYAAITEVIGYKPDADEWKVMALSGLPNNKEIVDKYIEIFKNSILDEGIAPFLKNEFYNTDQPREKYLTTQKFRELLNHPGFENIDDSKKKIKQWQIDVATAMQKFISNYTFNALKRVSKKYAKNNDSICLSGGFFMNCVFNGQLEASNLYKNVFISPSPADLGNSIGSALYVYHNIFSNKRIINKSLPLYTGTKENEDIKNVRNTLENYQLKFEEFNSRKELISKIIFNLLKNKVISLCNSRSEFGERALGARSIIAMPTSNKMKNLINSKIKYRESYRPFAPVCLQEDASTYFKVNDNYECKAMEKTVYVRSKLKNKLEAITHDDDSARLQTIDNNSNILLAEILREMKKENILPILVNTSFNLNGEPNVESLSDAIRTFYSSGLDYLIISDRFLVLK